MLVYGRGSIAHVQYTGDEAAAEIKKLLDATAENEDDFEKWEALVNRATDLEGGVTRNSSPSAIELVRNVYDCFLAKFPLFFGYWTKYAELEFSIGGTETSEMVYERGVSCVPTSVDLWTRYCGFKMQTCHDNDTTRDLFERAAYFVGLDFRADPFWDRYIEFEERINEQANIIKLYGRICKIPLYQFNRWYEKFRTIIGTAEIEHLVDSEILETIKAAVDQENQGFQRGPLEIERQIRAKIDNYYFEVYNKTQAAVTARWTFENGIKRQYFHTEALEEIDLDTWRKYLDFEEKEGDFRRTCFLYERCVVSCALYEEFWLRYARWLFAQGKDEDCRLVYMRASCIFVPISQSTARLNWARFEEKLGRISVARDIHIAILEQVPDHVETIISLAGVDRRHETNDAAVQTLESYIASRNSQVGGVLAAEQARILWKCKGSVEEARQLFKDQQDKFLESKQFWLKYMEFEIAQTASDEDEAHTRVKAVHDLVRAKGRFPADTSKELSHFYMEYLLDYAGKDATNEFMQLDKEINGYVSSKNISLPIPANAKPHSTAKKRKHKKVTAATAAAAAPAAVMS